MRPAAFLLLFSIDISVSFLPLHMELLYCPILNFSKEAIMGLPISVEFLFVGISILISGIWIDKKGWAQPFIIGTMLALCGIIYSAIAPYAQHFIVSRAIVGSGYGLSLMAAQGFVIRFTDWKTKAQGLASLFAGIYAGSICGTATGGMLSEWIDYRNVFLIGGCIMILVIIYLILFMRSAIEDRKKITIQEKKEKKNLLAFSRFLFNRTILSLIFFSSLPAAIAVVGFLNYFTPIYLNRIGASQSTIGQIIMLYGICLIYLGPVISRYVDTSNNKKVYIMMGSLIGSLALISFYFFSGLYASIVAIVLLGISSSLVLASQSVYALKLKVTKELGEGKAIGIFRSTSRVGQMIGPIVFSSVIALSNINFGITILGVVYVLSAILFLIFTQSDMKTLIVEES
jgi:predicted MFS family arabinose efflux permease